MTNSACINCKNNGYITSLAGYPTPKKGQITLEILSRNNIANSNYVQEGITCANKCNPEKERSPGNNQIPEINQNSENNSNSQEPKPKRKRTGINTSKTTENSQDNFTVIEP
ncbi:hypothetical protein NPIL_440591 [Nephila pilipes]|uniref:Uncharacterized protein n=1 Tax=Nephila pilipes TaxID=299642 RepID=A0A8X6QST3_NEPPI|nr:hypothetical protein NPIL_440591 [Nephila pilipes]